MFEADLALFKQILSFGIWPSLPIAGRVLLRSGHESRLSRFPITIAAGFAVWSFPLLLSVTFGIYRPELFGFLGWMITTGFLLRRMPKKPAMQWAYGSVEPTKSVKPTAGPFVFIMAMLFAAILYFAFPTEAIWGGSDAGIYTNHAIHIAKQGRLDIAYPYSPEEASLFNQTTKRGKFFLPGLYATPNSIRFQFSPVYPIWLAQVYATFGEQGLFRFNSILAILFFIVFFSICRLVLPAGVAGVATIFLAFNPAQIWTTRITLTEVFTQLILWSGMYLLCMALLRKDNNEAACAGVLIAMAAFIRIDSFLLLPCLLASHALWNVASDANARHDFDKVWASFYRC